MSVTTPRGANASEIIAALGGRGSSARCPAHEDRSPSLSVTERDGQVLVRCHAGCEQRSVIEALRARGLWSERDMQPWTPERRRDWARERAEASDAEHWGRCAVMFAEECLEQLDPADLERAAMTRLLQIVDHGGAGLVAEYRWWRKVEPKLTGAMVAAARHSAERLEADALAYLSLEVG